MAGINFLYEEYKKDPQKIEKLLDSEIEISEKLDGSRFLVQAGEGNSLLFFKRKDVPISKIDRTLSKYFESAINHFENFNEEKIQELPEGWRFGMEYFPSLKPVTISYDRLPLNNLVLTDIQVKDPRDKTMEVITDKETLDKWSTILEVEQPPIIFEGKLSDVQRRKILDFLNTPYSNLIERFKTESFTNFILRLLNPELKSSFMHNDMSKDIDGLVFRFDGKEAYRVSNPEIGLKKKERRDEKPSDVYNLTLVFLQEFLTALDFKKIKLKEKTFEERYIEFISQVYNLFLESPVYKTNFKEGVDFELPQFLTREESKANFKFVKNEKTIENLEASNTNRELFKILLASMRSHKRKPSGFFTKELIYHHNELVDKIADYVSGNLKENLFWSFQEFKSVYLTETENWKEEFGQESIDETEKILDFIDSPDFPTFDQVATSEETPEKISDELVSPEKETTQIEKILKKLFSEESSSRKKRKTSVCLIKGKFQPFHKGHESIIADAASSSGLPIILGIVRKRKQNFNEELQKSILDEVVKNGNIKGYFFTNGRSLREMIKDLPINYQIEAYAGSPEECDDAKLEMGNEFVAIPLTRHMRSKNVLQKLSEEDQEGFKKLVPKYLHNYFYKMKNEAEIE